MAVSDLPTLSGADEVSVLQVERGPLDPVQVGRTFRVWVTRNPIKGALLAGFVATHIATMTGFWLPGIGLPQLNWPVANGNVVLPHASETVKFIIGEVFMHGIDGVVFTLIFAIVWFPLMSPLVGRRVTPAANMAKALIFGLALGTLALGFITPYVYAPHTGAGPFSTGYGWKTVVAVYLWHIVFGANLGLMYNPMSLQVSADGLLEEIGTGVTGGGHTMGGGR
jgi:hypothetical protein